MEDGVRTSHVNDMKKTFAVAALAGLTTLGALVAPVAALADTGSGVSRPLMCSESPDTSTDFRTTYLTDKLDATGVTYTEISNFANCFEVTVLNAAGEPTTVFYDPVTLQQVG